MEEIWQRTEFEIEINKEDVFYIMDCRKDSPVYEAVEEEFDNWIGQAAKLAEPKAVVAAGRGDDRFGRAELSGESEALFVVQSVGDALGALSSKLFAEGDTLAGMLLDAMADAALDSLQKQVDAWIRTICAEKQIGILKRLEPVMHMPIEAQQWILEKTQGKERIGVDVTSGYMYSPVKSIGYVLIATKDTGVFKTQHNCRSCDRKDCRMRSVQPVKVHIVGDAQEELLCAEEESILDALVRTNYSYSFPCGGRGSCGKCRIQLLEGELSATEEDKRIFSEKELEKGYRLACRAYPEWDCTVRFCGENDAQFEVLAATAATKQAVRKDAAPYYIAIDIGTTTIAVSLLRSSDAEAVQVYTAMNRQRSYGTDVIARIQASCEGKGEALRALVQKDLLLGIRTVMEQAQVEEQEIGMIAIAGNTTMGHLLMGLSCETLGVAPFQPVDISMREQIFETVFGTDALHIPVLLIPGISTYVGADITAGMLSCGFADSDETALLIDLGTNGEMAIGNRDRIMVTSTAAGPAFEGGNISCGTGSVAGAIRDVKIDGTNVQVTTIGGGSASGICGTGAIATVAELLRNEWVDETGLLDEDYFDDGFTLTARESGEAITFTQKDVREMQLAIAAVRAGLETLLVRYGIGYEGVSRVYLAGGFGYQMNLEHAVAVGLIPEELSDKVEAVGNSSLAGAAQAVLAEGARERMERICQNAEEVNLSADPKFNEYYMEYMMFPEQS